MKKWEKTPRRQRRRKETNAERKNRKRRNEDYRRHLVNEIKKDYAEQLKATQELSSETATTQ